MAISRVKVWAAGEVLLASDLNGEFNNLINNPVDLWSPAGKSAAMAGFAITLDADGDSSIAASSDDRIDFALGGTTLVRLNTVAVAVNGIDLFGSITNTAVSAIPFGSDTDISLNLRSKGAGTVQANGSPIQAQGTDIVCAATINLDTATGDYVHVTGATGPVTAITLTQGRERTVVFDSTPTLTNGASLILLGGQNQVMQAGNVARFRGEAAGVVRQVELSRTNFLPTRQVLTSGSSATYTTPAGCIRLFIRAAGGGGGGGGNTGAGGTGVTTTFNSVNAVGGSGGAGGGTLYAGGAGGSGGTGSASYRARGNPGQSIGANTYGGLGGGSAFFGGGGLAPLIDSAGGAGAANTGGGGAGANAATTTVSGNGGGGGECFELIINNPAATYTYTIGTGGAAGATGIAGGAGGSGVIIVDEFYV